jgi:signal transduction histidine kinase
VTSQVDDPEVGEAPDAGRLRATAQAAGAALRATLYGNESPLRWGAAPDSGWRMHVVRLMPVLAALLAWVAVASRPDTSLAQKAALILGAAPVAVLLRWPLLAWRIAFVAGVLGELLGHGTDWPTNPWQALVFTATLFAVALTRPLPVVLWVGAISLVGIVLAVPAEDRPVIALPALLMVVGEQIRQRRAVQHTLAREEERSAVLAERTRIARELHDVVAHHMSLLAVRAETAPFRVVGDLPEPVRVEFAEISAGARQALAEMRRVLGVLRSDDQEAALAPQPGLTDIPALVDAARSAGADVHLELDAAAEAPTAVGLTGYRIVQEALANAARHAPGAPVSVAVRATPDVTDAPDEPAVRALDIQVHNAPSARATPSGGEVAAGPTGLGLAGMRERVAAVGGELSAGATPDGGFEVHARLPLAGAAP